MRDSDLEPLDLPEEVLEEISGGTGSCIDPMG